jgi:alginate O-acetyltransferase complex protein AlgI
MMATILAMLIAGFWHGANWTFVIFGALHGAALVINQSWRKMKWPMPAFLSWALTFTFVVIALVVFRSANIMQAARILTAMFTAHGGLFNYEPWMGIDRVDQLVGMAWMMLGVGIVFLAPSSMELQKKFRPSWGTLALALALAAVACVYTNAVLSRSFVYRDF